MNHFINFILKRTEGGATVDFIITLLTSSTAENHNFTTGYSLGWRHISLQNKFGIKKIKLVTILRQLPAAMLDENAILKTTFRRYLAEIQLYGLITTLAAILLLVDFSKREGPNVRQEAIKFWT